MKKIAAVLMVVAVTGCSSMGMGSSGGSGGSGMGMSSSGSSGMSNTGMGMNSRGPSVNQNPVIDSKGNLNIYHGG
jgi:hypothetical protein